MKRVLTILMVLSLLAVSGCYSCRTWNNLWDTGPVPAEVGDKFFFQKECRPIAKKVKAKTAKPKKTPPCGPSAISRGYPYGAGEVIELSKAMPDEVKLNSQFKYSIKVTNVTDMVVNDVVVTENIPDGLKVESASPAATKDGKKIIWKLGTFEPKESKRIMVAATALSSNCIKTCATAAYKLAACANINVVEPKLELVKKAPAEVLLCDPIRVTFVVSNPGTGLAEDVKIVDTLPAGLKTVDGKSKIVFDVGTLSAGQSRQFSATLRADKAGRYASRATAISASGLKSESQTVTVIRQPMLVISKTGPEKKYLGRPVSYDITVTNKGNVTAENLVVEDIIPAAVRSVTASNGGRPEGNKVLWNLGNLAPDDSRTVTVTFTPEAAGIITDKATATAVCAESVTASAKTSMAGIPAILLEVIDIDDPVEVGGQTTYVIVATNQGSAPGTNISIVCTLEDSEQYVSSSGVTRGEAVGNTITFEPLRNLPPKTKATWRLVVKAVKPGDVRFKVVMNTDQLNRPVEETEATYLYE